MSQIRDKRHRLYSRIMRKSDAIEDLLYSSKNKVVVEEELAQFNGILKLLVAAHEECKQYLEEEQINSSDEWLNEVDEENDRCSEGSSKTNSHSSGSSRKSSKSNSSANSKSNRAEGKVKPAKLLAQKPF